MPAGLATDARTLDPKVSAGRLERGESRRLHRPHAGSLDRGGRKGRRHADEIISANQALGTEPGRVSRVVGKEGKLSQRVSFRATDQVLHDDLTELPNRVLFGDRVDHADRAAARRG